MKRIKKLAKEHAERLCESRAGISAAEIDFEAGFRKARDMAAQKIRESFDRDIVTDSLIEGAVQGKLDYEICSTLGEEEVD